MYIALGLPLAGPPAAPEALAASLNPQLSDFTAGDQMPQLQQQSDAAKWSQTHMSSVFETQSDSEDDFDSQNEDYQPVQAKGNSMGAGVHGVDKGE